MICPYIFPTDHQQICQHENPLKKAHDVGVNHHPNFLRALLPSTMLSSLWNSTDGFRGVDLHKNHKEASVE